MYWNDLELSSFFKKIILTFQKFNNYDIFTNTMNSIHKNIACVLFAGRIYEEDDVFKIIKTIAEKFATQIQTVCFFLDQKTLNKITKVNESLKAFLYKKEDHGQLIDYLVTVGGDGTILYAAMALTDQVPIISFSKGTLGFMCRFHLNQIDDVVQRAIKGLFLPIDSPEYPFEIVKTMRLSSKKKKINAQEWDQQKLCVNEVYISRQTCERLCLQISIDGQIVTETSSDGILISTPTGSTAYSLSAGGPIMQNGINGILMVPIAPNSLSFRPICFSSDSKILLRISQKSGANGYVSYDGQTSQLLTSEDQILVTSSYKDLIFLQSKQKEAKLPTWVNRLKNFLRWNEQFKSPSQICFKIEKSENQNNTQ